MGRVRVRKRKRGRNKARSVQKEPKTRGGSGKRAGKKKRKCHAGTEARGKEPLSRHGTAGKCVGERIGGYLVVRREGSQTSTHPKKGVQPRDIALLPKKCLFFWKVSRYKAV